MNPGYGRLIFDHNEVYRSRSLNDAVSVHRARIFRRRAVRCKKMLLSVRLGYVKLG